jgi:hypothetical protein
MPTERCSTCGREFRSRLAIGVHQSRARACHDPDAARCRAREREARYRARHPDRRRQQARDARRRLLERRPDYLKEWRAAHRDAERARQRRWRQQNPERLREQRRRRAERLRVVAAPLPPSHAHHPLFDAAWAILDRLGVRRDDHLAAIHDTRWEDACSEAVLALLEGRDAMAAARAVIARARREAVLHRRFDGLERVLRLAAA